MGVVVAFIYLQAPVILCNHPVHQHILCFHPQTNCTHSKLETSRPWFKLEVTLYACGQNQVS